MRNLIETSPKKSANSYHKGIRCKPSVPFTNQRTISDTHLSWSQKWGAKRHGLDVTNTTFSAPQPVGFLFQGVKITSAVLGLYEHLYPGFFFLKIPTFQTHRILIGHTGTKPVIY
jgi:hypothetical protein